MRVLMIDDELDFANAVKTEVEETVGEIDFQIEEHFNESAERIAQFNPDIVILDVYRGALGEDAAGQTSWEEIWNQQFCPVIIYSAGSVEFDIPEGHPFVKAQSKGAGSVKQIIEHIQNFRPHIDALNGVVAEIGRVTHRVLRDISSHVFREADTDERRRHVLIRCARRYVAAVMDEQLEPDDEPLLGWEHYLVPALGSDPLSGDILHENGKNRDDPVSYRLILSPSCDIAVGRCKVDRVLVAKTCDPFEFVTGGLNFEPDSSVKKIKKEFESSLNRAQSGGYVWFHEFPDVLPPMALNLKSLDLIPPDEIGTDDDRKWQRVVSVDSPFREQIVWAYLEVSGRPGMPNRDFRESIDRIVDICKERQKK